MSDETADWSARCSPNSHDLRAQVDVRATVVLSPVENAFEFWGDYEPDLVVEAVECTACGLNFETAKDVPEEIAESVRVALMDAVIMQPLRG